MMFREITGQEPPPTPVTARMYTDRGLPWFDLYDEHKGDVAAREILAGVKSIHEMERIKGYSADSDTLMVDKSQIIGIVDEKV